ncbi:MAG: hypothetical protein RIT81_09280 [Deltaproteobacteria bacterium]
MGGEQLDDVAVMLGVVEVGSKHVSNSKRSGPDAVKDSRSMFWASDSLGST